MQPKCVCMLPALVCPGGIIRGFDPHLCHIIPHRFGGVPPHFAHAFIAFLLLLYA